MKPDIHSRKLNLRLIENHHILDMAILTWNSMDGKCGAFCAGEQSEHAPNVRRFSAIAVFR